MADNIKPGAKDIYVSTASFYSLTCDTGSHLDFSLLYEGTEHQTKLGIHRWY
jgi:hypothetical protein